MFSVYLIIGPEIMPWVISNRKPEICNREYENKIAAARNFLILSVCAPFQCNIQLPSMHCGLGYDLRWTHMSRRHNHNDGDDENKDDNDKDNNDKEQ